MYTITVTVYSYRLKIKEVWHSEIEPVIPRGAVVITKISKSIKPEDDVCEVSRKIEQEINAVLTRRGLHR